MLAVEENTVLTPKRKVTKEECMSLLVFLWSSTSLRFLDHQDEAAKLVRQLGCTSRNDFGTVYIDQGRLGNSETIHLRVSVRKDKTLGKGIHPCLTLHILLGMSTANKTD